ncbi:MAG: hypothetical protein UCH99_13065 [Adlercreutzia sp.]|nr:CNNM domain-containing protein [Adlercreutzia sp.]MEE0638051.1 hypothetical protein [Adlercreutzia sp.]
MNAFFVIAEFALVRVRKSQIDMAVAEKRRGAEAARDVTTHINAYLRPASSASRWHRWPSAGWASRPSPPFWKHRFWPGASPRRRCTPSAWPWASSS